MIISKKSWKEAWTNCSYAKTSQLRLYETPSNSRYTSIEGYLSITRIPIYTPVCVGVSMDDFCNNCMKCQEKGV